jgi:hypothetical protein
MNSMQNLGLFGNLFGRKTKAPTEYDDEDFIEDSMGIPAIDRGLMENGFFPSRDPEDVKREMDAEDWYSDPKTSSDESLVPSADADTYNDTIEAIGKPFFNTEDSDGEE